MTTAQTQLYFRTWQAAAQAHGWSTKPGIAAALDAYSTRDSFIGPFATNSVSQPAGINPVVFPDLL